MKRFLEKNMTFNQQYGMAHLYNIIRILLDYGIDFELDTKETEDGILKIIAFKDYYFAYDGDVDFPVHKISVVLRPDVTERKLGTLKITEDNAIRFHNLTHDEIIEVSAFKGMDVIFNSIVQ